MIFVLFLSLNLRLNQAKLKSGYRNDRIERQFVGSFSFNEICGVVLELQISGARDNKARSDVN